MQVKGGLVPQHQSNEKSLTSYHNYRRTWTWVTGDIQELIENETDDNTYTHTYYDRNGDRRWTGGKYDEYNDAIIS